MSSTQTASDPDDNKFVDCAIVAGATYIVSNDRHFEELKNYDFPRVDVRNLSEFLDIVRAIPPKSMTTSHDM